MSLRDFEIAERTGCSLAAVLSLPAEEWMAWHLYLENDLSGSRGVQTLLAKRIAQAASSEEHLVDFRDVAPWLFPGHLERQEQRRLERLPEALRGRSRAEQDEYRRRRGEAV